MLATRYCGPFEILEKIGPIAYMIALHASMRVHNVFYVSLLKKYVFDSNHIEDWTVIQVENCYNPKMHHTGLSGIRPTHASS